MDAEQTISIKFHALPHSKESESALISALMQEPNLIADARAKLPPAAFYHEAHRIIFERLLEFHELSLPVDAVMVTNVLRDKDLLDKVGGPAAITELFTFTAALTNYAEYIRDVEQRYQRRRQIKAARKSLRVLEESEPSDTEAPAKAKALIEAAMKGSTPVGPDFKRALLSAGSLCAMTLPQRPGLLGQWMKEGDLGYLFAPRGAGKSWLAMLIAKAISEGAALGEWQGGEARPVTYLDCEMNLSDLRERLAKIGATGEALSILSNESLFRNDLAAINIANPTHQAALSAMLAPGCLFIIDNLSTAQVGIAENENDAFDLLRPWLLSLRHRRITTLIVHHAGRNGFMRGASRREDMAHWIISLKDATPDGGTTAFLTTFVKCRNCRASEAPPLLWTLADTGQGIKVTCKVHSGPEAMLGHIRDGVSSASELADLLGVAVGTVSKWAKKLQSTGLIRKDGRGYAPAEPSPFDDH